MNTTKNHSIHFYLQHFFAFLISVIGIILILKSQGFYPFKDKTLFAMDMKGQYLEFFASLRYAFSGENSLFFSWSRSLGGNYFGLFAYYLISPLSFITLFFSLEELPLAIFILTVLKIGLCGWSFSIFACYLWKKYHTSPKLCPKAWQSFILLPFAVSYALMSYNIAYSMCLMWLDGVILLPLVLLGVEKLLEGNKGLHYVAALTAVFICNYYIGYIIGIFTALYMCFRVSSHITKNTLRQYGAVLLRFTLTTLMAIGLSMPVLLPVVKDLAAGKLSMGDYQLNFATYFPYTRLLEKFQNGAFDSVYNGALPYVYCGYLILILTLIFFLIRQIPLREKLCAASTIGVFLLSFRYISLDHVWHGFQWPNSFPFRYSFTFSFFLLYLAVRTLCCLLNLLKTSSYWVLTIALLFIVTLDCGINGRSIFNGLAQELGYTSVEEYENFLLSTRPLVEEIKQKDKDFYRINQGYEFSKNDAMLLGYNGMTHFSSTYNGAVNTFLASLGVGQGYIWNSGYGTTPLLDSVFGVKYLLADSAVPDFYTKLQDTKAQTASYANRFALPIAYSTSSSAGTPTLTDDNPFVNQNNLLNSISGDEISYFTEYHYDTFQSPLMSFASPKATNGWSYSFTATSSNPVYLYMKSEDYVPGTEVIVNGKLVGSYFLPETNCALYLGCFTPGEKVTVDVLPGNPVTVTSAYIAQLHTDILQDTLSRLQTNGIQLTMHQGGSLQGTIHIPKNAKIMTSIPYDEGWTVRIDGKKANLHKFADTFLMIEASPGTHEITFSYVSPGFGIGVIIGIFTLLLCTVYFGFDRFCHLHN